MQGDWWAFRADRYRPPQKWPLKISGFPWGLFHPKNQWSGKSPQLVNWVPGGPPGRISLENGYLQKSQGT